MSGSSMLSDRMSPSASSAALARSITQRASRQTYHTIRWLVDRGLTDDAFRAYAYFRWVDDTVDAPSHDHTASLQFIGHQRQLMSGLWERRTPASLLPQEQMLSDLLADRRDQHPGLRSFLENMMAVMEFDAGRRGRLITQAELDGYTALLSTAVWDCIEHFIGHTHRYPTGPTRTRAVTGAHVVHMLRDTYDDVEAGYFNVPREVLEANRLAPSDVQHPAYRRWVHQRVEEARRCFAEGKAHIRRMGCLRAQIATQLYCARFETVLRRIELDGYTLQARYSKLPPLPAWMSWMGRALKPTMRGPRQTPTGSAG